MKLFVSIGLMLSAQAADTNDFQSAEFVVDPRVLSCSPAVLTAKDALVLDLGPQHGRELAIRRVSDDTWHFLVVDSPEKDWPQLMSPSHFATARKATIPASFPVRSTQGNWERVLDGAGDYEAYVSDNLESEEGGHVCGFKYTGLDSPSPGSLK